MSAANFKQAMHRSMKDEAFLDKLRTEPDAALAEYELTEDERAAIKSGDEASVQSAFGEEGILQALTAVAVIVIVTA